MEALGIGSLARMSKPDGDGRPGYHSAPQAVAALAEAVAALGIPPAAFAFMPADARLRTLGQATSALEARARSVAAEALAAVPELRMGNHAAVGAKVRAARDESFFLPDETARRVDAAAAAVDDFERRREELVAAFERDLPGRLQAGQIGAESLVSRDSDGWFARDDRPDRRFETAEALYLDRMRRLKAGPQGPWTLAHASDLKTSLRSPAVASVMRVETRSKLSGWLDAYGDTVVRMDPALSRALSRGRRASLAEMVFIEDAYKEALLWTGTDATLLARTTAWIRSGSTERLSITELSSRIAESISRRRQDFLRRCDAHRRRFFFGLGAMACVPVIAVGMLLLHVPIGIVGPLGVSALAASGGWAAYNLWRRSILVDLLRRGPSA